MEYKKFKGYHTTQCKVVAFSGFTKKSKNYMDGPFMSSFKGLSDCIHGISHK